MTSPSLAATWLPHLRSVRLVIPVHMACVLVAPLIGLAPPLIAAWLVDGLVAQPQATGAVFLHWLPWLLAAGLAHLLLSWGRDHLGTVVSEHAGCSIQVSLYEHLQRLSADFYQLNQVGEITTRLTSDVNRGVRPLYGQVVEGLTGLLVLVAAALVIAWYSTPLVITFVILSVISLSVTALALPRIHRNFHRLQDANGQLSARITEAVAAHALVRAAAREDWAEARLGTVIERLRIRQVRAERFLIRYLVFIWAFDIFLGPFILLLIGAVLIAHGTAAGSVVAAIMYWRLASEYRFKLTNGLTGVMSGLGALRRILAFFAETPLVADAPTAVPLRPGPGAIRFHQVQFRYPGRDSGFVLGPLDVDLPAGQRTALVGPSGAGKSTLVHLLCRVYDPDAGSISIDGQDLRTVTQVSLRRRLGCMSQDTLLFDGSLADNLRFVSAEATATDMRAALGQAGLEEFLAGLPEGLETRIGERGVRLSGGQRQRLAIARILLADPEIVILDEPTSALDARTEAEVWTAIDAACAGRTQLIVSHRIATALHADRVLVLEAGRLLAAGTAFDVHQVCTLFQRLCSAQHITVTGSSP